MADQSTCPAWVCSRSPDGWDQIPRWAGGWVAPATLEFWVRFPNERNQGKQDATLFYSTGFLTGPKETRRSLARNGPMVRATFWNSKLSTPRNHRHWFCIVAIFTHVLSNRQVPGSSQPNRRATRCLGEIWISDCMLQRLHARLLPLRIRILHTLTHTEFG